MAFDGLLRAYRATGADPPFGDPRRAHDGVAMEGYFWRFTEPRGDRVIVALCGVNLAPDGHWANVALAAHPGSFSREGITTDAAADPRGLGARAGRDTFAGGPDAVHLDLGPDARLDVRIDGPRGWRSRPFGGLGAAHAVPGLNQYWHPHVLGGTARGRAILGDEVVELDGWTAYAEKNWGRGGFPDRWWWGQAHAFDDQDVCVAFAGGEVRVGPATLTATAVAVRLGDELVRLGQPLVSPVRADVDGDRWTLHGRGPVWSVEVEGRASPSGAHVLPVPVPPERRTVPGAHQHLAGRLSVTLRRRGRVVFAGESSLAGLEHGDLTTEHPRRVHRPSSPGM